MKPHSNSHAPVNTSGETVVAALIVGFAAAIGGRLLSIPEPISVVASVAALLVVRQHLNLMVGVIAGGGVCLLALVLGGLLVIRGTISFADGGAAACLLWLIAIFVIGALEHRNDRRPISLSQKPTR